jgi:hypothetical protein
MKTIIITIKKNYGAVCVHNQHVTCLGDAILKTKELHPDIKLRDILAVETMDEGTVKPYKFTQNDLERQKRAAQFDNVIDRALSELKAPNKIVPERDTYNP